MFRARCGVYRANTAARRPATAPKTGPTCVAALPLVELTGAWLVVPLGAELSAVVEACTVVAVVTVVLE